MANLQAKLEQLQERLALDSIGEGAKTVPTRVRTGAAPHCLFPMTCLGTLVEPATDRLRPC